MAGAEPRRKVFPGPVLRGGWEAPRLLWGRSGSTFSLEKSELNLEGGGWAPSSAPVPVAGASGGPPPFPAAGTPTLDSGPGASRPLRGG